MKFRSLGSEQFHADRRVERHRDRLDKAKLTFTFRNFANAPKNERRPQEMSHTHTQEVSYHYYENQLRRNILSICRSWCKVFVSDFN